MKHLLNLLPVLISPLIFAAPSLTIYNQNFAVVRDNVHLDLQVGVNNITFNEVTLYLEPDSVILRDPSGSPLQILEQNYRNDPVTQALLLSFFEDKEIDFIVREPQKQDRVIRGRIVRSGYVPVFGSGRNYGMMPQSSMPRQTGSGEPIIEVDGKIQFGLPGQPLFPSLGDDTILKPQLSWKINSPSELKMDAELGYITGRISWETSYNVVAAEESEDLDIIGWVTIDNQSGRDFNYAKIKLMAGNVNKLAPSEMQNELSGLASGILTRGDTTVLPVTEKTFDEYHLYSLERPTTLRDRETKQVEFVRAKDVKSEIIYVYDGLLVDWNRWRGYDMSFRRNNEEFGSQSQTKVAVMREFKNTSANGLGIPLPKGRVRFYRADDSSLEFTGENQIDHTPVDETVKIYTGDAFDLVGERKRKSFRVNLEERWVEEAFEITLRNRKKEPVTIRVIEHLYRGNNWSITEQSDAFEKKTSDEILFQISIKPGRERKVTYQVHYSW